MNAQDFFRVQVQDYDALHYGRERTFMSVRLERMIAQIAALGLPEDARVFEAGCGPGRLMAALAIAGWSPFAIDTSRQMLQLASDRLARIFPARPVRVGAADIRRLPFREASFDLVCTAGVTEYLPDDDEPLRELCRVLRPGGVLIYSITNRWAPTLWPDSFVQAAKRCPPVLTVVNRGLHVLGRLPARPLQFSVRRQSPTQTRASARRAGLLVQREEYFYYLPWPHPLDRLFPILTEALGKRMEWLRRTPFRAVGEGFLLVLRKPT
jgi:SAM-dependent methyltransferase